MTKNEYAKGLLEIFKRGWSETCNNLESRHAMGMAETHWLMRAVPEARREEYFVYARQRIWLDLGGKRISLQEYLGSF